PGQWLGDAGGGARRHADGRLLPRVAADRAHGPVADASAVDQPPEPGARARGRPGAVPGGRDGRAARARGPVAARLPRGSRHSTGRVQRAPGPARRPRRRGARRAPRARGGRSGVVSALTRVVGPLAPPIAATLVRVLGTTLRMTVAGTEAVGRGCAVAVVPDGPRGPCGQLQPGVVTLAALPGAPIVPLAVAARPALRLRSWDAFMIPYPFARCAVVFGAPLVVARDAERERAMKDVARHLDDATAAAERLLASW